MLVKKWAMMVGVMGTVVVLSLGGTVAWAQQKPALPPPISAGPPSVVSPQGHPYGPPSRPGAPSEVAPPEAGSYPYPMNLKPLDPKAIVQQRAAQNAEQRARRLAALKWFGFSNSRPVAGVDCIHGDYAPRWTSNHPHYPFRWSGVGGSPIAWYPAIPTTR